ncbi:MAG: NADH-quinone oxidoreductase subunit K [Oscillospiraceae bacterium]|nr:NADH-quinone oxidoreductase subunit K [Oscillospiraceae bacterium]
MLALIVENRYTITAVLLFMLGFGNVMLHPNLIKKVVAFNIMDAATFLLLASRGMIAGRTAAILTDGGANPALYVNPIPAGLVLTGIVVSVSVSAFSLALIQRIYGSYGTVDMRELLELMKKRGE